ncbi:MAG: hypothetical protein K9H64_23610 [Bacteroidales bacterium]|nr:hypothetical protein [Bacteroidales bacterium]MCF8459073.1 hypothetical protein [Bacteroidales bacterium]
MCFKRISLVFALLFSVFFTYSQQSYVDVTVDNHTDYNYYITVEFNQTVTIMSGSNPFYVPAHSCVTEKYALAEYDVNLSSINCKWESGGTEGNITLSGGYTSVYVSPQTGNPPSFCDFVYYLIEGQDTHEHSYFRIDP